MPQTFESHTKEFINEAWCYFLNNITTLDFAYAKPDETDHTPLPTVTNATTFIKDSSTTLLKSLEALSEELSLHGMIDEENSLTWGNTVVHVMEQPESKEEDADDIDDLSDDTHEEPEKDDISYIDSLDDDEASSTSSAASTVGDDNELRQELYDQPIRTALIAAFPPASRLAEHDVEHLTKRLKVVFEKLLKDGL
jgi:hypothetical protein